MQVSIENKNLENNCLFVGDRELLFKSVMEMFKNQEINLFEIQKLNISVDDVRRMISFVNRTSEGKKVVTLSSFYWPAEAQNAMLKVLEETPPNTFIYLFGMNENIFLPTILSRIQKVNFKNTNRYLETAKEILSLDPNERLENKKVKKILSLKVSDYNFEKNSENEKKDRESHILFLQALMEIILDCSPSFKRGLGGDFLNKLSTISTMMSIEGGSPHLFIEWLLLSAPKI